MTRVDRVDPASTLPAGKPPLDRINGALGVMPDMFRAIANQSRDSPRLG
jgi:hypothetical protein